MTPSGSMPPGNLESGARQVVRRLRAAGYTAYWAGGCVRDRLLGRPPADYDIATDARPEQVQAVFPEALSVGRAFGVMRVPVEGHAYEVATFRGEHGYRDGRHPDAVTFTDARTDALRRDFTVNALFYDVEQDRVVDFVGGRADLEARLIRSVGSPEERFREDHLRLLRAVRFAHTLGFRLEPTTEAAIRSCASLVTRVAAERVQQELTRLWMESLRPGDALLDLDRLGLLRELLPEVAAMKGVEQPAIYHPEGDVFAHTARMLNLMETRGADLAWAALLHDVGKPLTLRRAPDRIRFDRHDAEGAVLAERILQRLRFPRERIARVTACVRRHMRLRHAREMRRSTLRRLVGSADFEIELELHRLDCLASHGDLDAYRFLVAFRDRLREEPALPPAWVSGRDLLAMGVPEGPELGRWKRQAYDAQLEGRFASREELLAWLREAIPRERSGRSS